MSEPQGWSAEMDRRLAEMREDPEGYIERVWREAHEAVQADLPILIRRAMRAKRRRKR